MSDKKQKISDLIGIALIVLTIILSIITFPKIIYFFPPLLALLKNHYEAIIALLALFLTFYEIHASRKHNRLSVKPSLSFNLQMNFNEKMEFIFILGNKGLGPGILTAINFSLNNQNVLENTNLLEFFQSACDNIQNKYKEPLGFSMFVTFPEKGFVVQAGEETEVVKITLDDYSPNTLKDVKNLFQNMDVHGTYESFYGEKFRFHRIKIDLKTI